FPSQLGVVWSLLLQADSGGPSPISDKAFTAHNFRDPSSRPSCAGQLHFHCFGASGTGVGSRYGGSAVATRWPHRVVEARDLRLADALDVPWSTLAVSVPLPGEDDLLFIGRRRRHKVSQ